MNRFKSLSHPLWFWTVSWFHAVSEGDYVSTSINRKWLWRIVSHDPIYTKKIDDLNVHFVPVTKYHYLGSNLRLTNTYSPCEQDFTNCNQFCTMWKNNNMWTYFHNEFFPMYQSNSQNGFSCQSQIKSEICFWFDWELDKFFILKNSERDILNPVKFELLYRVSQKRFLRRR